MDRQSEIDLIASSLYRHFVRDDGGEYLSRTGEILRNDNLKVRRTRESFESFRSDAAGLGLQCRRFWTKKLIKKSVSWMMEKYQLSVPMVAGFTWRVWLEEQTKKIQGLTQKGRRNFWRRTSSMSVDDMDTLEYDVFFQDDRK